MGERPPLRTLRTSHHHIKALRARHKRAVMGDAPFVPSFGSFQAPPSLGEPSRSRHETEEERRERKRAKHEREHERPRSRERNEARRADRHEPSSNKSHGRDRGHTEPSQKPVAGPSNSTQASQRKRPDHESVKAPAAVASSSCREAREPRTKDAQPIVSAPAAHAALDVCFIDTSGDPIAALYGGPEPSKVPKYRRCGGAYRHASVCASSDFSALQLALCLDYRARCASPLPALGAMAKSLSSRQTARGCVVWPQMH